MSERRTQLLIFKGIYGLKFFSECLFTSYTGLYLLSLGYTKGLIGTINSITALMTLILNPIWAIIARDNKIRKILLVLFTILQGTCIIIYGNLSSVELIMTLTALIAVATGPYISILDSFCISACNNYKYEYSKIRIYGSITYLIGFLIGGYMINAMGYGKTFMLSGSILIVMSILVLFIRISKKIDNSSTAEAKESYEKVNLKEIVTNKFFIIYTIAHLLCFIPSNVSDVFLGIYLEEIHGFTALEYSYLSVAIVSFEILFSFISPYIFKRVKDHNVFSIACLCILIKNLSISIPNLPAIVVIIGQLFRGAAIGMVSYYGVRYVFKMVGEKNVSSATMINGVLSSVLSIILNNLFGHMLDCIGYNTSYFLLSVIMSLSIISYPIIYKLLKARENNSSAKNV